MKRINQILIFMIVSLMSLTVSVSATQEEDFCTDYDYDGVSVGPNIWTPSYAQDNSNNNNVLVDDCDGSSENLKEATCKEDKVFHDNIQCIDYGAVCVTVGDKSVPDYCGCPQGTHLDEEQQECVEDEEQPPAERSVPEFGVVAAGLALAGAGVYIARKRRK